MILPTLYTERLMLRPISILDADDMYEYAKTPYVGPQAGWAPHQTISETMGIIKNMIDNKPYYELGNWAIVFQENGRMIGTIELYNHVYQYKAELGYALNPDYWGLGIVPEATREVLNYGFNFLKLKRIEVGVFPDNHQSVRVCEKLGFVKEGVARKGYLRYDGKIFDKVIFAMTDNDYHEIYG